MNQIVQNIFDADRALIGTMVIGQQSTVAANNEIENSILLSYAQLLRSL